MRSPTEEAAHPIYGMPILLKDNINTANMPTTAGAALLADHASIQRLHRRPTQRQRRADWAR